MTIDTIGLPHNSSQPDPVAQPAALAPWGFWGTLGWGVLAAATGFFATVTVVIIWMLTHGLKIPDTKDATFLTVASIVATLAPIVVLAIAVKVRKWRLGDYFALGAVRRRDLVLALGCLIMLVGGSEALATLLGVDNGSEYTDETYRAARLAGMVPLLWLAVVVVAPLGEELLFRGFLYRGWASSWLGVGGTILVTSLLWAMLHQQYNWYGILVIFCLGLLFGWLRQRSGTTTLTMILHALNNLFTMILVAAKLEWAS
jgi:membrane protease YdiL (CAAX protease family)